MRGLVVILWGGGAIIAAIWLVEAGQWLAGVL